jgi:hypothetical protein
MQKSAASGISEQAMENMDCPKLSALITKINTIHIRTKTGAIY